jgi:serine phosphatase RsbU (regulator of sigma subunit)
MQPEIDRRQLTAETKVGLLLEVSGKIRGTLDLDEILDRLLATLCTLVDFDAGGIFVLHSDLVRPRGTTPDQLIAGVARRGYDRNPTGRDPMLHHGAGITGHVIQSGEIHLAPDVRHDPHYVVGREATLSEIAVPIRRYGRTVGALNLESDRLDAFGEREIDVLTFFAEAAGIAIEMAMLHERLVESERLETQMRTAQEVQSRLLPACAPDVPGYELAGLCIPTHRIGGDYFDYLPLADGRLALTVADVAGKGVAAALVMAAFRSLLRSHLQRGEVGLSEVARAVNVHLPESLAGAVFVTAFFGILDPRTGHLTYINCGHNPPFVVRSSALSESHDLAWLDQGGTVLGIFPEADYEVGEVVLEPGDVLALYTDGVVESADQARTHFGAERLADVTARLRHLAPHELVQRLVLLTREFSGALEFDDDFTLVALRRCPRV